MAANTKFFTVPIHYTRLKVLQRYLKGNLKFSIIYHTFLLVLCSPLGFCSQGLSYDFFISFFHLIAYWAYIQNSSYSKI